MKPPSPMLAPKQRPLKPASPLHPKTAPKTPISHPQRRWRFQLRLGRAPAKATAVSDPTDASKQRRHRSQEGQPGHRTQMRYPWAAAGPGRATSGRPTLQTSSNQRNSHRLTRTPVTNVVNPSPKTAIFSEKALRLTTFVTTDQKSTRKTPRIDDVCNNMHQSTPKDSTRETPVTPTGSRGTGPRCRRAVAGPGQNNKPTHRATSATWHHWCGGHRRVRRAWLQCSWAAEEAWLGFEPTHKHTSAHQSPLVWRAPEGLEGLAAVPMGGGWAWPGFEATRKATHQ